MSPADLPGVLEELAQAIERYPRNTDIEVGHDRAELARQIRALAG